MIIRKQLLILAIATLITVLSWVILDTIHKRTAVEVPEKWQQAAEPLDPNFNLEGINQ